MTPGSSIIASPQLRCRHRLRRVLSGSALPILPQSVSRAARISGLPDSRICYGLPSCSPPLYGSDRCTRPPRAFTSRLPTDRSPSPLPDISTTATGLLCWRDSHPLEWQLASLHQNYRAGSIDSRRRGAAQPPRCATTDLHRLSELRSAVFAHPYAEQHATWCIRQPLGGEPHVRAAFSPPHLATLARCLRPTALASPSTALAALWAPRGLGGGARPSSAFRVLARLLRSTVCRT
jgi:hypothetical protein